MNVPREPILKSEKWRRIFFPRFARTDGSYTPLCATFGHGCAELELNPPFQNPGSATALVDICRITEAKTKSHQKRGLYLKLDDGMRANVHVCIHWLVIQLQYLVPREIEKSCTLHSLLPWGDCESRNAGTWNGTWKGSTKVKFSVTWSTRIYKIGSGKLKLALVCVRDLQKLAIVAMKSLSIWPGSIKRTITWAWLPITPNSYTNRGRDRSCENTDCGDAMDSYPCSLSLDSRPFQVHTEIRSCDATSKQHGDVTSSSCHSERE